MSDIPVTVAECANPKCKDPLNLLGNHLKVMVKPQRNVLVTEDVPASNGDDMPDAKLHLGIRMGRGVLLTFHNFACAAEWFVARKSLVPKLQYHHEEGDMYVPEDNRSPEELVKAGDLPKEMLAVYAAQDDTPEVKS